MRMLTLAAMVALLTSYNRSSSAIDFYTAGHADVSIVINGSAFDFEYELAANAIINGSAIGTPTVKAPGDLVTVVPNSSRAVGGVAGLPGTWATSSFWYIPQISTPGVPFLGIGAEEIATGRLVGDNLKFSFDSFVSRPSGGEFLMFQNGLTSPTVYINTADGIAPTEFITVASLGHDHYNWSFSTPGNYQIRFKAEGTLVAGSTPISGLGTYTFQIVPEPGTWALGAICSITTGIIAYRRRRQF
ncbi:MAG: choice-of-anchor M domain-containing protein [bacterium]